MKIVLATRRSALALAQARAFAVSLQKRWPSLEVVELHVVTTGDRVQDRSLQDIGGKGLFIKEVEAALLDGSADFAVHSLKDLPGQVADGLCLGAIPEREDPRDVVVTRSGLPLQALPHGAVLGTSSLRRQVHLRELRPDCEIVPLRGNVDTRLRRCAEGAVDAIILAAAGLRRLGWADRATQVLEPEEMLPAVGQGALAIECRADDVRMRQFLGELHHVETALRVEAERGFMDACEGSCHLPVAAHAVRRGQELWLRGFLAATDGSRVRRGEQLIPWPMSVQEARAVGLELGARLRAS